MSAQATAPEVLQSSPVVINPNGKSQQQERGGPPKAVRHHLPDERKSITHKFSIAGHEGYLTVGLYPDGRPGEIFILMAKEGSTVSGLISSFAQVVSLALQHGVPLQLLCEKFRHTRFEPSGWTGSQEIRTASSVMDYIFHWLELLFAPHHSGLPKVDKSADEQATLSPTTLSPTTKDAGEGPPCRTCGSITERSGTCYYCRNCGSTSGCG